jgi:hypothetical protein
VRVKGVIWWVHHQITPSLLMRIATRHPFGGGA